MSTLISFVKGKHSTPALNRGSLYQAAEASSIFVRENAPGRTRTNPVCSYLMVHCWLVWLPQLQITTREPFAVLP
jgi:hypothetical protein